MTRAPASIVQNVLVDTVQMNTPEAWARFGERVVKALRQADFHIVDDSVDARVSQFIERLEVGNRGARSAGGGTHRFFR